MPVGPIGFTGSCIRPLASRRKPSSCWPTLPSARTNARPGELLSPWSALTISDKTRFIRLAAEKDAKPTIKAGSKIVVDTNACSWDSELSPVVTVAARATGRTYRRGKAGPDGTLLLKPTLTQKVVATDETGHQWRIKFSQVDWVKTAEANGIPLANPDAVNHIGPVVTEEEMRRIEDEAAA